MSQRPNRIPALDGLRGVAVLAVFASHAGVPGFALGGVGVDVFFVLSGYLITSILLGEIARTGSISLPRFYLRRVKRLTPALFALTFVYAIVAPMIAGGSPAEHAGLSALSFFYLMDYARAFWIGHGPLVHTWSLAVEEHFYLVWPLVLIAMSRWLPIRHWLKVLAIAYLAATLWRCASVDFFGWAPTYFRFDTRMSALILGSLLAVLFKFGASARERQVWIYALIAGACSIAVLAIRMYDGAENTGGWATLGIAIAEAVSLAVILIVVEQHGSGSANLLMRALSGAALTYVGRISYGLYLFHHPLTYWLWGHHWSVIVLISLPLSFALAALSYRFIEQPILEGRNPLSLLTWRPVPTEPAHLGVQAHG
ncbi:MAG: acyltransferase family protein [Propylenella sp.]